MCAVAMGKAYPCKISIGMKGVGLRPGFDSHKSSGGNEWVVFDSRQIIPLCVLHLTQLSSYPEVAQRSRGNVSLTEYQEAVSVVSDIQWERMLSSDNYQYQSFRR